MPSRITRKRTASQTRANKKHANNVARVLKNKLTKLVKKQTKRKTRKLAQKARKRLERNLYYAEQAELDNEEAFDPRENHRENPYDENNRVIRSLMRSLGAPVRPKVLNNGNFYNSLERSLGMKSRKRTGNHTPQELLVLMKMNAKNAKNRGIGE
jgi:hypothetical protein